MTSPIRDAPKSAPGLIVEALRRRRRAGMAPFTVLTCDNLPSNGRTVHRILTRYATLVDRGSRRVRGGTGRLPVDDGRPDRAGDDG